MSCLHVMSSGGKFLYFSTRTGILNKIKNIKEPKSFIFITEV